MKTKIEKIYLFFCPTDLAYLYLNGSQVRFTADQVSYENPLLTPGQKIINWENRPHQPDFTPSMYLPNLLPRTAYSFKFNGEFHPRDSVALVVNAYDEDQNKVSEQIVTSAAPMFTLPQETVSYSLALINLNTVKFTLTNLIVARAAIMTNYRFKLDRIANLRVLKITSKYAKDNLLFVHLVKKRSVIQELSFIAQEQHLFIFVPQNSKGELYLEPAMVEQIINYLIQAELQHFSLRIDRNRLTEPITKRMMQVDLSERGI
ncbi:accessory Sec system protein Asp3 [Lactobacillus sp. ESL0785]|uniref:accessory Sec system protein Asp3 n=1 Tax=Lactobacillus sp. ESL0785 TaxID=2983232 RepID=UPI0023F8C6E1|nr:accessory Sec system protein Asp3 [Lactobacillus sp. ESL0785]WEV71426.1 accessory Sec system protein Asp3 [Lactobacillus sp. ESL0785]